MFDPLRCRAGKERSQEDILVPDDLGQLLFLRRPVIDMAGDQAVALGDVFRNRYRSCDCRVRERPRGAGERLEPLFSEAAGVTNRFTCVLLGLDFFKVKTICGNR